MRTVSKYYRFYDEIVPWQPQKHGPPLYKTTIIVKHYNIVTKQNYVCTLKWSDIWEDYIKPFDRYLSLLMHGIIRATKWRH